MPNHSLKKERRKDQWQRILQASFPASKQRGKEPANNIVENYEDLGTQKKRLVALSRIEDFALRSYR